MCDVTECIHHTYYIISHLPTGNNLKTTHYQDHKTTHEHIKILNNYQIVQKLPANSSSYTSQLSTQRGDFYAKYKIEVKDITTQLSTSCALND